MLLRMLGGYLYEYAYTSGLNGYEIRIFLQCATAGIDGSRGTGCGIGHGAVHFLVVHENGI